MKDILTRSVFLLIFSFSLIKLNAQLEKIDSVYALIEKKKEDKPRTLNFIKEGDELVEDYSKLAQIILVRHGEPALDKKGRRNRKEAMKYVIDYDSVGILIPEFIPVQLDSNDLHIIYTSSIYRSISTAEQVFDGKDELKTDTIFREFERKIFAFPNVRLPLKVWLTTSRVFWFMGFNKRGVESFSKAKKRAKKGAELLELDALENKKTVLVSHGLINRYLSKYLKKRGWKEVYNGGHGYLSQKMLVKYFE